MELSDIRSKNIENIDSSVNRVYAETSKHKGSKANGVAPFASKRLNGPSCYRCGSIGHFGKDPACPAKSRKCHKCHNIGHFQKCCKSKAKHKFKKEGYVKNVEDDHSERQYAFTIPDSKLTRYKIKIGQIPINIIVDSGSSANIIDEDAWEHLKEQKILCHSNKRTKKKLGKAPALLSRETAEKLGILKIGTVYNVEDIRTEYGDCIQGIGKLKDFELKLHINEDVEPVAQKAYSVPISLREKVAEKLEELEEEDIIEKAEGPTPWVIPVVVVPKPSGDIRICVDMRQANKAITRERHPIPTVDEVLVQMNNSCYFSKIDLNMAIYQIPLAEESRFITTFVTHKGLYRYKRLSFGVNAAPEMFQHIITQVLQSCDGVANIADDIIVHGQSQKDHDANLKTCMETLKAKGLTVNLEKSQFNMNKITFMGHVVSDKGIVPTEERVKDLINASEPKNASEVRSFLGLVNFSARYIPDLATVTEPLRKLTKKNAQFQWKSEEKKSFNEIKRRMANTETLAYFKPGCKTKLVTDASNVGLGAVLVQEQHGKERVISYASRTLSDSEKRYSTTEKEALAISEDESETEGFIRFVATNATPSALSTREVERISATDEELCDFRYYEIDIIKTIASEKIIDCLEKMFIIHGLPVTITSDNGRPFVSDEFEKYLFENNIEHRRTTPLHPSANGKVERQNRTLLKRIKIANAEGKNWKIEIRKFLLAYRTTPHSTTGVPPSELMFNRKIRTKLPEIQFSLNDGEVRDRDMFRKEKKPYRVVEKYGNQVSLESPSGVTRVRNSTHVKEFREPEVETSEGGLKDKAVRLLMKGCMPMCPPAKRDWSDVTDFVFQRGHQKLCWPPANWRSMTADQMAHEYAAIVLEKSLTATSFPTLTR
ncbi:uncharacterized protein K02A2.6-like [Mya arenaria]|uniref:uncharacterized protein K02A2.6-like n=1 Tax=Mya arenaria TaxID=6604 RepID=UPI0022DF30F4|nr:uncharacterized protein K02A2.6-like [Mya arenaria]